MDFDHLLKQQSDGKTEVPEDDGLVADCLDHSYFLEEIRQLLRMHKTVEQDLRIERKSKPILEEVIGFEV